MEIAGMPGSMMGGMPQPYTGAWWMGMVVYFLLGSVIFFLVYAYLLYSILPGANWLRGFEWATGLWFLTQMMVMPMMATVYFPAEL